MDCTFAVLFRDVLDSNFGPVYLWCDSSPQAGVDWLLSIIDYIAEDHLEECHQKYQALYRSTSLIQQSVEDVNLLAEIAVNRADAIKFLRQKLHRHRQMPMGLGSGASKLEKKCQALAMKLAHETHSFQALRRVAKQIVSVTVDMGVESGVADAQGGDVVSYLPPWMAAQDCLQEDAGLDAVEVSSDRLFPRSLLAAGLDHISNNLLSDMDQHLQCWDGWLPGFKALAHLLSHKHLLSRLVGRCILGTPHQALARMFETCIEPIAKWRWGTIVKTLPSVLRLERGLRIVWDEQKFLARGETMQSQGQDDSFDCSLITKTIQDNSWWAMSHMLLHLHSIGNLASAWGSSCHCHEWITEKPESQHFAMSEALHRTLETLRLEKGLDGANVDCPLKGKRAPELAAGMLMPRINELVEHCTSDVLLACSSVSAEQREKVVNDFTLGVDYIRMTLDVKLGHWATLPWLLAALSLPEPSVQHKAIAQRAIEEFDKLPAIPIHHHQLTWQILNPSSTLRSQLEAVAQGALLASLPGLASEVARLSFVPVVERIVEGAHSLVHRHTGYRKISGAYVSCSHRLPEMEAILDTDDGLENFCAAFEQLRKPRQLAKKFRLQDHPLWLELTSKPPKQQSGVQKLLKSIVYSTDAHTMYVDHAMSRKQHDKRQCAAIKAKLAVNPKPKIALTQDSVMQHALVQHVQEMLIPGEFYSFPVEEMSDSFQALSHTLALPAKPHEQPQQHFDSHFFKVVSVGASRLKTVKSNRRRLSRGDIAVTLHESGRVVGEQGFVDTRPLECSQPGDTVHVLSAAGVNPAHFARIQCWKREGACQYTLPHFDNAAASQLLEQFFERNALEGKGPTLKTTDAEETQILHDMCFEGWVLQCEDGWQLAKAGVQQLRVSQGLHSPRAICDRASQAPLKDKTTWEILQQLVDLGWTWKKVPPKKKACEIEPYALDKPRFWYTAGTTVRREYVLCLLQSDRLLQVEVPGDAKVLHHAMPVAYYNKVLAGDFDSAYMIANAKPEGGKLAQEERPMLADEGMVWANLEPSLSIEDAIPNAEFPKRTRKRKRRLSSSDSEALLAQDFGATPGHWVSESESEAADDPAAQDIELSDAGQPPDPAVRASAEEPTASAPVEDPDLAAAAPIARVVRPETLASWGRGPQKFRIIWRPPSTTCKHGAWQDICPYHRKSATAKCTRSLNLTDGSPESREACLRMIQNWLLCADKFDRAWKHGAFNPRFEETPPEEVLLARSESMQMPGEVQLDVDLDVSPAPKAKAKSKKASGAKAKPKAKAGAKASSSKGPTKSQASSSSPSDSSSDSGSSSSSSS